MTYRHVAALIGFFCGAPLSGFEVDRFWACSFGAEDLVMVYLLMN